MVPKPSPVPGSLDEALASEDAAVRLQQLSEYIRRGEQQLDRARRARAQEVADLREAGVAWPQLVAWSGISDSYLRRELRERKTEDHAC